jgi:hypothetical protein
MMKQLSDKIKTYFLDVGLDEDAIDIDIEGNDLYASVLLSITKLDLDSTLFIFAYENNNLIISFTFDNVKLTPKRLEKLNAFNTSSYLFKASINDENRLSFTYTSMEYSSIESFEGQLNAVVNTFISDENTTIATPLVK